MKPFHFFLLYCLICVLHLTAIEADWMIVESVTKPMIVLWLLGYYLLTVSPRSGVFIFALVFCCIGDTVLLFQSINELFFMLGLGSFLVAHIFYILAYRQARASGHAPGGTQKIRLAFPVVVAGTGLVVILLPSLGGLKIPVMIYSLILTMMVIGAIFRFGRTSEISFWFVFLGALFFMTSDSLLAINKFLKPFPFASVLIMISYCAAQFLIVEGMRRQAPPG